ncbi:hypothetical protein [Sphingomonas sp.]|uniref:hypothetical protein n=1 Tax=Sphingomonas sp. TaxID=28214 RepID=UPI001EC6576A|nr:hypothetical protein [Sphingomonas sp.]MBX3592966.1 hypothetical protein [Sphingomonas sp.]
MSLVLFLAAALQAGAEPPPTPHQRLRAEMEAIGELVNLASDAESAGDYRRALDLFLQAADRCEAGPREPLAETDLQRSARCIRIWRAVRDAAARTGDVSAVRNADARLAAFARITSAPSGAPDPIASTDREAAIRRGGPYLDPRRIAEAVERSLAGAEPAGAGLSDGARDDYVRALVTMHIAAGRTDDALDLLDRVARDIRDRHRGLVTPLFHYIAEDATRLGQAEFAVAAQRLSLANLLWNQARRDNSLRLELFEPLLANRSVNLMRSLIAVNRFAEASAYYAFVYDFYHRTNLRVDQDAADYLEVGAVAFAGLPDGRARARALFIEAASVRLARQDYLIKMEAAARRERLEAGPAFRAAIRNGWFLAAEASEVDEIQDPN